MAGDNFGKTVYDPHERFVKIRSIAAEAVQQSSVWSSLKTFLYAVASQPNILSINDRPVMVKEFIVATLL